MGLSKDFYFFSGVALVLAVGLSAPGLEDKREPQKGMTITIQLDRGPRDVAAYLKNHFKERQSGEKADRIGAPLSPAESSAKIHALGLDNI